MAAYSFVSIAHIARNVREHFGADVQVWNTEYNYAASTGKGNKGKEELPYLNGTMHGILLAGRVLASVRDYKVRFSF